MMLFLIGEVKVHDPQWDTVRQRGNGCPLVTHEPEWANLSRFTVLVVSLDAGGKSAHQNDEMFIMCVELRVPLQALNFQGTEIAFHVPLIQVVIAGRPEL